MYQASTAVHEVCPRDTDTVSLAMGSYVFFLCLPAESNQMNSMGSGSAMMAGLTPPHPYPPIGQLTHPYEQQQPGKEINKYASLKAVGERLVLILRLVNV